ncbi:hypothetical protein [Saccharibacillus brassicae]|uniref:Uncharacterized protein n=1 Tax=Saccharibacillus brassicae TaxID=2583377 RepID=A0A4Y6V592_SACBS|nr:hypothetical protein [Saccharibacillus brassicae]QDH23465.1 hypothetical protein FFV09_22930 [Saccharibacillus brassicae]
MPKNNNLEKQLKAFGKKVAATSGPVSMGVLFNDDFISRKTDFENSESFFQAVPVNLDSEEEYAKFDESELDTFIAEHSKFNSWKEFMQSAATEQVIKRLK